MTNVYTKQLFSIIGIHLNTGYILLESRPIMTKILLIVIRAIPGLNQVYLYLYGNGDLHEQLINLSKELKVEDRILFTTSVPNETLMQTLMD